MTAREIAAALDGASRSGGWWRCRCPVHGSQGATLALRDGDLGLIVKCWAGCDRRNVLVELRRRGLIDGDAAGIDAHTDPAELQRRQKVEARERRRRIANAFDLWGECYPAPGTIVERYGGRAASQSRSRRPFGCTG